MTLWLHDRATLLIASGAGFIGSHLIDFLLNLGLGRVIVLQNFNDFYSPTIKHCNVELLRARYPTQVADEGLLKEMFSKHKIHQFVFASTSSVCGRTDKVPFVETDASTCLLQHARTKRDHSTLVQCLRTTWSNRHDAIQINVEGDDVIGYRPF